MQKHLMVAGCSFSATTTQRDGTSWSERLANKLGWRLTNLARQGCSNGGIRIQIEEIRRQRPDFAIVTPTFWDRMEIPAAAAPYDWSIPPGGWNPPLQQHLQNRSLKNGYDRKDGIDNVNYGNNNYNMICETIFTLAENYPHAYRSGRIDVQTQKAVRQYINAIYDNQWKKQMDEWIITEGVLQLFHDGIAFLFQPTLLWPFDVDNKEEWKHIMPKVIPAHYVMSDVNQNVLAICGQNPFVGDEIEDDPGYHSNATGQQIIADNWYNRITQDHGLQ